MNPKLPADKETLIWLAIGIDFRAPGQIDPLDTMPRFWLDNQWTDFLGEAPFERVPGKEFADSET